MMKSEIPASESFAFTASQAAPYDAQTYQALFDCFSDIARDHAEAEAEFSGADFKDVFDFNESFDEYVSMNPQGSIAIHLAEQLARRGLKIAPAAKH